MFLAGEASPSIFWDASHWKELPENRGLDEPKYVTAHYVKHIVPDVKIIVILRDPTDRYVKAHCIKQRNTSRHCVGYGLN